MPILASRSQLEDSCPRQTHQPATSIRALQDYDLQGWQIEATAGKLKSMPSSI